MKIAALLCALALADCTSAPPAPGVSRQDADNACDIWAYQNSGWIWLGALGTVAARSSPQYRDCMARAGYAVKN